MSYVNIGGDKSDSSYRYKMPRLVTKVEGRGNGIKTVIVNMVDIAKALHTDPSYPTKFFGIELGAQSKFDSKTDRAIVNGKHDQPDMAVILDKFIDLFILCPRCRLPEHKMKVRKEKIKIECASCGHNDLIETNHKLTTYILKNPPLSKKDKKEKEKEKDKKDKKKKKKDKEKDGDEKEKKKKKKKDKKKKKEKVDDGAADDEGEDAEGDDSGSDEVSAAAEAAPVEEKKEKIEWFTDTSESAVEARKDVEWEEMNTTTPNEKVDITEAEPHTVLNLYMTDAERSVVEITNEIKRLQLSRSLDEPASCRMSLRAVYDGDNAAEAIAAFKENASLIREVAYPNTPIFMNVFEEYAAKIHPSFKKYFAHLLKTLYEEDALDEADIIAWFATPVESAWLIRVEDCATLRKVALPFIQWLKEAEEESEEEDDE